MIKKFRIKLFFLNLGLVCASLSAYGENGKVSVTDVDLRGTLRAESLLFLKPSGLAGQSRFSVPFANVEGLVRLENHVEIDFEGAYRSPVAAGQSELSLPRLNVRVPLSENWQLTAGLFESSSLEGQLSYWRWDNLSKNLGWLGVRWGYRPASDYGFEIVRQLQSGAAGFSMSNGEGYPNSELGPQKDFALWIRQSWGDREQQTELLVEVVQGGYEDLPVSDAHKDRYHISLLSWGEIGLFGGVEGMWTSDPVDAINQKVADSVDLTDLGGRRVDGSLMSLSLGYAWGRDESGQWVCFGRFDAVRPMADEKERGIESSQLGFSYSSAPGQEWIFLMSDLSYGQRHSVGVRDEQAWSISYNVLWD